MKKLFNEIKRKLKAVNFNEIVQGFHAYSFALFDDEKAVLDGEILDKPKEFIANSAVEYNGDFVATYYYDFLPKDIDLATSLIVHEMFHAFQFSNPNFLELQSKNDENIAVLYEYKVESITMRYNEVQMLIEAYLMKSKEKYDSFLSIREKRANKYPEIVSYENITETIEGFATYVELMTLKQINEIIYKERVDILIEELQDIENFFSIRELSYKVGALILLVLKEINISFMEGAEEKRYLSEIGDYKSYDIKITEVDGLREYVDKKMSDNKIMMDEFFSKDYIEIDFDTIIGYNPMGAIRHNNRVLIKYLLMIEKNEVKQNLNGYFCLEFNEKFDWIKLYKQNKL